MRGRLVHRRIRLKQHSIAASALDAYESSRGLRGDQRRVALKWIAPSASTPGNIVKQVSCIHLHMVALGRQHLRGSIRANDQFAAAGARQAAIDAPGTGKPGVGVDLNLPRQKKAENDLDSVAAAMKTGPAAVDHRLITLDAQWK